MRRAILRLWLPLLCLVLLSSCHTARYYEPRYAEPEYAKPERPVAQTAGDPLRPMLTQENVTALINESYSWVGTPYRFGGEDRYGIDCSALVCQVFRKVYGKMLHRNSNDQFYQDIAYYISGDDLQPGDLVFFNTKRKEVRANHVGIYLGNHCFLHASGSRGVVIDDIRGRYFSEHWIAGGIVK